MTATTADDFVEVDDETLTAVRDALDTAVGNTTGVLAGDDDALALLQALADAGYSLAPTAASSPTPAESGDPDVVVNLNVNATVREARAFLREQRRVASIRDVARG